MYNFNQFGHCVSYMNKIQKHINAGDCSRLKDYICAGFDTFDASKHADHPCYGHIDEAVKFIKQHGWRVQIRNMNEIGPQVVVISPENHYYHSKYKHDA